MLAAVRSELTRLRQPRFLITWFGLMALFTVLVNTIMITFVSGGGNLPPGAPGVAFPTLAEMESPSGLMAGLAAASNMFGIVTLSFWAVATATDYSSGLVRLLVSAQPHRWRLLAGKVVALAIVTAAATVVAAIVNVPHGLSFSAFTTTSPITASRIMGKARSIESLFSRARLACYVVGEAPRRSRVIIQMLRA